MAQQWEVVGGGDKGGIVVREGKELKSKELERVSTGAILEEIVLQGERLNYKLISGTGPEQGWVSLKVSGKEIVVKKEAGPEPPIECEEGPGNGTDVEVDAELKARIEGLHASKKDQFELYLMKYKVLGYPLAAPKLRVLCFHNAGSAESAFTGPGTPLVAWAKETKAVEICAFDYPGRDKLLKADKITDAKLLAEDLMAVFYEKMNDGVPYVVWGHSVGTWVGFEFLQLARKIGCPMPKAAFFMAFPAPHVPANRRKWHINAQLNDKDMRTELLNWDKDHFGGPGGIVFGDNWKDTWEPLMRADFCLFDEYKFDHNGAPKFDFPIHAAHFDKEYYNTQPMVELWKDWTTSNFDFKVYKDMGHLTCVYRPEMKKEYFGNVRDAMKGYL